MKARIRLSVQAVRDLAEIEAYIAGENPAAAQRVIDEVYATQRTIGRTPVSGEACHHLAPGLRRFPTRRYRYVV